jgi:cytochrome c5
VRADDKTAKKTKVMVCADCHQPEAGGVNMRPINMRENCAECHDLAFSPFDPTRMLPHGDLESTLHVAREFYADVALRGGIKDVTAPASVRRRPGTPMSEADRLSALQWARKTADEATAYVSRSVCGTCHDIARDKTADGGWRIKKVTLADNWFEKSWFPHNQHQEVQCATCHKAATSKQAGDVLLPGIDTCRNCHGGAESKTLLPSTCVDCHDFHLPGKPHMLNLPSTKKTALQRE